MKAIAPGRWAAAKKKDKHLLGPIVDELSPRRGRVMAVQRQALSVFGFSAKTIEWGNDDQESMLPIASAFQMRRLGMRHRLYALFAGDFEIGTAGSKCFQRHAWC